MTSAWRASDARLERGIPYLFPGGSRGPVGGDRSPVGCRLGSGLRRRTRFSLLAFRNPDSRLRGNDEIMKALSSIPFPPPAGGENRALLPSARSAAGMGEAAMVA